TVSGKDFSGIAGADWAEQTGAAERIAQSRMRIRTVENLIENKKVSCGNLVRSRGLEPPRLAALAPQASASASSATTATISIVKAMEEAVKRTNGELANQAAGLPDMSRGKLQVGPTQTRYGFFGAAAAGCE